MDLKALIEQAIALKEGNKQFAIFYYDFDQTWSACLGNPCRYVNLGEIDGELESGYHSTPEEAVGQLIAQMTGVK